LIYSPVRPQEGFGVFGWLRKKTAAAEPVAVPRPPGEFQGSPWNAEPTEDWNRPPYWQDYYRKLLAEKDAWRRELVMTPGQRRNQS
jgi:hypothetical protein